MKKTLIVLVVITALVLTACQQVPGGNTAVALADTNWVLSSLGGTMPKAGTSVTMKFGADGTVSGSDGCNRFNTTFTQKNDSLTFVQPGATTMMACEEGIMSQASKFSTALASVKSVIADGSSLILKDAEGMILATFVVLSQDLTGTSWKVVSFNNGKEAVVGLIEGTEITATFDDVQVSGSAGCNRYFAGFAVDGGSITIDMPGATMMFCETPAGVMEQEAAYLAALESAATYINNGDSLEFRTAADQIAVMFVPASAGQ